MSGTGSDPQYPRSYTLAAHWKYFLAGLGFVITGFGLFGIWQLVQPQGGKTDPMVWAVLGLCGALFGLFMLGSALISKLVLEEGAIENHEVFFTRRLERGQIKGLRRLPTSPPITVLVPSEPGLKKISISSFTTSDDTLRGWLAGLPDLDAVEMKAAEAELLQNTEGGIPPEQRRQDLTAAKRTAKFVTIGALLVCGWGWFYPDPYYPLMALLAGIPWLTALVVGMGGGLYTLNDKRNDPRAGVGGAFFVPCLVLFLRGFMDIQILDWTNIHLAALGAAVVLCLAAAQADKQLAKNFIIVIVFLVCTAWGYGCAIVGNAYFDTATPQRYKTLVIEARHTTGKGAHPEFVLEAWGPVRERLTVPVSESLYHSTGAGGTVCVYMSAGALQARWFQVEACRGD